MSARNGCAACRLRAHLCRVVYETARDLCAAAEDDHGVHGAEAALRGCDASSIHVLLVQDRISAALIDVYLAPCRHCSAIARGSITGPVWGATDAGQIRRQTSMMPTGISRGRSSCQAQHV